jgi:drug/metabolite transporter (DMT)-like permease
MGYHTLGHKLRFPQRIKSQFVTEIGLTRLKIGGFLLQAQARGGYSCWKIQINWIMQYPYCLPVKPEFQTGLHHPVMCIDAVHVSSPSQTTSQTDIPVLTHILTCGKLYVIMNQRTQPMLPFAILIAILSVSTASIFIRFAQNDGVPSLVIAALRLTFATLILAPIVLTRHREELKHLTLKEILPSAFAGIFLALHFATWISSLEYTSVASSVVFVSTGPLWVALLSPILLKEQLARTAIAGLVLSLLGGTIIGLSDACIWDAGLSCPALQDVLQGRAMFGNFLALAGAWMVTGYLIIGRKLRARISLVPYIFMVYGFGAVTLIVIMFASGSSPFGYAPKTYGWIFLLAALPQLIGHSTYNWALKYLSAALVAVTTLGEPIGSAILAFFILSETPTIATLTGGAFILTGIYLASKNK